VKLFSRFAMENFSCFIILVLAAKIQQLFVCAKSLQEGKTVVFCRKKLFTFAGVLSSML